MILTRRMSEIEAIRKAVWTSQVDPPTLKLYPSKWYVVQDLEADRDAAEIALKEIRRQEVVGVALRGKVRRDCRNLGAGTFRQLALT